MKPPTNRLTARLSAFGPIHTITSIGGGHRNPAWRVDAGDHIFVAKSTTRSEPALRWMAELMALARTCGIDTPTILEAEDGCLAPNDLLFETFIDGPPGQPADVRAEIAQLHDKTADWQQRPGFIAAVEATLETRAGDLNLPALPPDLATACLAAWHALPPVRPVAIHGDLNASNIICQRNGRPALIDWDECRVDHPGFDTLQVGAATGPRFDRAHLAWEVAACWHSEPTRARKLARQLMPTNG